jgi:hypothetical protein
MFVWLTFDNHQYQTQKTTTMDVKIALFHKGLMATYKIDQVDTATYNARLKTFSGDAPPPSYIKFYKTEVGWRSAFEDAELIRELGAAVEGNLYQ